MKRPIALAIALLAAVVLPLAACSSDGSDGSAAPDAAATDSPAPGEASAAIAFEEGRTVIDVRTPEEFDEGHILGAERIGLADADFTDRIAELDADGAYVVYCRSGNRSAQAAAQMRDLGLDVLDGGAMDDMVAAGWDEGE
ncbi:MAG: rhodanese-like domain-containing protein [Acidimicrobiales bacterium]|nr:rhodanese-like domain-containing protein [Acidimicrobiales bacterium]HRW37527.1 rhodanese-like domain-containing protein [Aquihabitans sp.]